MRRRGFTIVEILVALLVATMTFFTFMTVFRSSYNNAAHTRNRAIATIVIRSLMDEIESHPYGTEAPANWALTNQESPARIFIAGKPVSVVLHKKFTYLNSSFVTPTTSGSTPTDYDVVTIAVSWHEAGARSQSVTTGDPGDNQEIQAKVPVWR